MPPTSTSRKVHIFSAFNPPPKVVYTSDLPTMTQQHFRNECDINWVYSRYVKTGVLPVKPGAFYGDFTSSFDYQSALDKINEADDLFMAIPSQIRMRFANDPAAFLKFTSDPANADELVRMGLAVRRDTPEEVASSPLVDRTATQIRENAALASQNIDAIPEVTRKR